MVAIISINVLNIGQLLSTVVQVMGEANFLQKIKGFDKDNVSAAIIAKIKKYVTVPDFTPEEVSNSPALTEC